MALCSFFAGWILTIWQLCVCVYWGGSSYLNMFSRQENLFYPWLMKRNISGGSCSLALMWQQTLRGRDMGGVGEDVGFVLQERAWQVALQSRWGSGIDSHCLENTSQHCVLFKLAKTHIKQGYKCMCACTYTWTNTRDSWLYCYRPP